MAQYKVPQDVEAEDKLIGPFSFRQFIYLGVAALGIAAAVGLWQLFPGLIVIPLPVILLFLVLALPLRKDQPMETYLTAVIRFFLKPRRRLWQPEGSIGLVTIVAPRTAEVQLTKSVGGAAAAAQLSYLSQVVDTQGWATRGVISPPVSMNDIAYAEAQQAEDVLDENTNIARTFDSMIGKANDEHKRSLKEHFQEEAAHPPVSQPAAQLSATANEPVQAATLPVIGNHAPLQDKPLSDDTSSTDNTVDFTYNPYPASMHQHVVRPIDDDFALTNDKPAQEEKPEPIEPAMPAPIENPPAPTSAPEVSPDIMRLANNNDLSISAIANEAHRLEAEDNEEVVINLH